jgi:hypothetical protein
MAASTIGVTILEAVNDILRGSGLETVDVEPTSGDSDEGGQALEVLDRTTLRIMAMGWPENTERGVAHTPAGSGVATAGAGVGSSAAFVDGAWTASTRTLGSTASFTSFTVGASGDDEIYIYSPLGNTDIREGYYPIATSADANTITLTHEISSSNETNVGGRALGDLKITLAAAILAIEATGASAHRNLALNRDEVVYDQDLQTDRFTTDDPIYLDLVREYTFTNIAPGIKELIVAWARVEFQRWRKSIQSREAVALQEAMIYEARVKRNLEPPNNRSAILDVLLAANRERDAR